MGVVVACARWRRRSARVGEDGTRGLGCARLGAWAWAEAGREPGRVRFVRRTRVLARNLWRECDQHLWPSLCRTQATMTAHCAVSGSRFVAAAIAAPSRQAFVLKSFVNSILGTVGRSFPKMEHTRLG